jgi:quercetin dioxygenase-like cupin family protein
MSPAADAIKALRFVTSTKAQVEFAPWGKHWWLSRPGLTDTKNLTLVRVRMRPGAGHRFHRHPTREEIIYVLDGVAEQWVGKEQRRLKAGEIAFIPKNVVHAIHNSSKRPMNFLAILSPARAKGPFLVDCGEEERWRRLWERVQRGFRKGSGGVQKGFEVQEP